MVWFSQMLSNVLILYKYIYYIDLDVLVWVLLCSAPSFLSEVYISC